jgi:hypothetical protein
MAKPTINKSQFIRSFPSDTSPAEIVAAAKAKGISFSPNYVSTIRSASNKKSKKSGSAEPKKPGRPKGSKNKKKPAAAAASAPRAHSTGAESTFKKLVLDLGTTRARQLLDEVQKALAKIVG